MCDNSNFLLLALSFPLDGYLLGTLGVCYKINVVQGRRGENGPEEGGGKQKGGSRVFTLFRECHYGIKGFRKGQSGDGGD